MDNVLEFSGVRAATQAGNESAEAKLMAEWEAMGRPSGQELRDSVSIDGQPCSARGLNQDEITGHLGVNDDAVLPPDNRTMAVAERLVGVDADRFTLASTLALLKSMHADGIGLDRIAVEVVALADKRNLPL